MLLESALVFDQVISGTGKSWYTSADFNASLGRADILTIQAVTTSVFGTGPPKVTVATETSFDGRLWASLGNTILESTISDGVSNQGSVLGLFVPIGSAVRLKISLGASCPMPCCTGSSS
jgi:hypothetical protein